MIHQFDPVIYPRKIWITYDATVKELNEYFPEGDGCERYFGEMYESVDASVYFTRNKDKLGGSFCVSPVATLWIWRMCLTRVFTPPMAYSDTAVWMQTRETTRHTPIL